MRCLIGAVKIIIDFQRVGISNFLNLDDASCIEGNQFMFYKLQDSCILHVPLIGQEKCLESIPIPDFFKTS